MSGLRKALITRIAAQGKQASQPSEVELLQQMDRLPKGQKPKPKFGYGGDVDGKTAEGVGSNSGGGYAGDWGGSFDSDGAKGAADWGGDRDWGGAFDGGGNNSDFGGYNDRGSVVGGSFSDFGGITSSGRQTGSTSYNDGMANRGSGIDWAGEMAGATLGGLMDGVSFDGGGGDYGFSDVNFSGGLAGLGLGTNEVGFNSFGRETATGALPGEEDLPDYQAPGMGALAPTAQSQLSGLAALASLPDLDGYLSPEDEQAGYIGTGRVVDPANPNFSLDPRDNTSLARPDARYGAMAGLTENRQTFGTPGFERAMQAPVEVAMNRASQNYRGFGTSVEDQLTAPSQFSGLNKAGKPHDAHMNRVMNEVNAQAMLEAAYGVAKGTLAGERAGVTRGAMNLDGSDKYGRTGKGHSSFGEQRAWGGNEKAAAAFDANREIGAASRSALAEIAGPAPVATAPLPPERPPEQYGPSIYEGDVQAAGRVSSFENGQWAGANRGLNIDSLNASLMNELSGASRPASAPAAKADASWGLGDLLGISSAQAAELGGPRTALGDLAFGLGTSAKVDPTMDFTREDLGVTASPFGASKDQARVAERTDLPQGTFDQNAAARATLDSGMAVNAQPAGQSRSTAPAAPSNSIAAAISGFFGFDTPSVAAPAAPATVGRGPSIADAFDADATARGTAKAAQAAPAATVAPEEEAAKPNSLPSGVATAATAAVAPDRTNSTQTRSDERSQGRGASAPAATSNVGSRSPSNRGVATGDVYGPTMPGMPPGSNQYPTSGIINQPSTAFHEKVMEPFGAAVTRGIGSAMTGGLFGLADMASGLFGGPSTKGLFSNTTPGFDIGRSRDGLNDGGGERIGDRWPGSPSGSGGSDAPKPSVPAPSPTGGTAQAKPTYARTYKGPAVNPLTYGYGGEQVMWKGSGYATGGYVDCGPKKPARRGGALPMAQGIKAKAKGTA